MTKENRITPPEDEIEARNIVADRKVDERLKRFITDVVLKRKEPERVDALVIAYALMQASSDPRSRKALGLSASVRGKNTEFDVDNYPREQSFNGKNLVQIALRYMAGKVTQDEACQELRVMLGDDRNEKIDKKTLTTMLDDACNKYAWEYQIFGDLIIE